MSFERRFRFYYWLARDLSRKYSRWLAIGFIIGFSFSFLIWQLAPLLHMRLFAPVVRIGVVGTFTSATLPKHIQQQLSFGLTTIAIDGSIKPGIAGWWEATESGKLYTFHLRNDIAWHDGKKLIANDITYGIRDVNFATVDNTTIQVRLSTDLAFSPLPSLLAKPVFKSGLIGVGPYKVDKIKLKGDIVSFLKIIPVTDTALPVIEYRFYSTESQALLGFKLGEVSQVEIANNSDLLKNLGKLKLTTSTRYDEAVTLFFNIKDEIVSEKSIRQALGYALPTFPYERAYSPIAKTSWAYLDKIKHFDPDQKQATKLLQTAKYSSESGQLVLSTFAPYLDTAQAIVASWSAIGISSTIKVENAMPSSYQILLAGFEIPPDPDQYPFWHSTQSQTNIRTNYGNPRIDKFLEEGRKEQDPEKRKLIYFDFQKRLVDDAPAIFLYYPTTYTIYRNK